MHQNELDAQNIGLRSILHALEKEKKVLEEKNSSCFYGDLIPLFNILRKSHLNEQQNNIVDVMESVLTNISSSLTHSLKQNFLFFTPAEMKVANFIKAGKSSKDIASTLTVSERTVEGHRSSIRKKLGLKSRQNLQTSLENLPE